MTKAKTTKAPSKPVKAVKAPVFNLITGSKAIDTAIKSIATRGKSLDKDIHIAAVSTLMHADEHGDVTLAQRLVDAIPQSARKNALKDWFLAMGKFSYDTQNKTLIFNKQGVTMKDKAIATPFWAFKPEPEYKPFDINAAIAQLVTRANKAVNNGDDVDQTKLAALTALAA